MHRKNATHKQFSCLKHKQLVNMNQDTVFKEKNRKYDKRDGNVLVLPAMDCHLLKMEG